MESFLQSKDWGEFKTGFGWEVMRRNGLSVLKRPLRLGLSLAYVPHGDDKRVARVIGDDFIKDCVFVRIDPLIEEGSLRAEKAVSTLTGLGFKKSFEEVQPRRTLLLDLEMSEPELLAEMHSKGRYNIRLAEKKGVKVRMSDDVEGFAELSALTAEREGIKSHGAEYFERLAATFKKSGKIKMFTAELSGRPLSSIMVVLYGSRATYLFGGSTRESREYMPNHAAQWAAIKYAKSKGYKTYDFWGIAPADEPNHPWAGISRFKRQFGGREVSYIGAYDLILNRPAYFLYKNAQRLRKRAI